MPNYQLAATESELLAVYNVWNAKNLKGLELAMAKIQRDNLPTDVVAVCLKVLRDQDPEYLRKVSAAARAYKPKSPMTATDALTIGYMCRIAATRLKAVVLDEEAQLYHTLQAFCVWAAMKMGAKGGWATDSNGFRGYVVMAGGLMAVHYGGFRDGEGLANFLGEFAETKLVPPPKDMATSRKLDRLDRD